MGPGLGVWWNPEVDVQLKLTASRAEGRVEGQIDDRCAPRADRPVAPDESAGEVLNTLEWNWRRTGRVPAINATVALAAGLGRRS